MSGSVYNRNDVILDSSAGFVIIHTQNLLGFEHTAIFISFK